MTGSSSQNQLRL
ncbi:unnamed protein product [Debaryomyces tyrocola]|nr:unnamed protein product [Debaryomyces tyrocola]